MTATLFSEIEEVCPGGDALLGQLYHASTHRLPIPLMQIPDGVKSELALFCYRRGHLREIGLAIAAACDEADLVRVGSLVGSVLFARSTHTAGNTFNTAHPMKA